MVTKQPIDVRRKCVPRWKGSVTYRHSGRRGRAGMAQQPELVSTAAPATLMSAITEAPRHHHGKHALEHIGQGYDDNKEKNLSQCIKEGNICKPNMALGQVERRGGK